MIDSKLPNAKDRAGGLEASPSIDQQVDEQDSGTVSLQADSRSREARN